MPSVELSKSFGASNERSSQPLLSIVIPTRNRRELLKQTICSLFDQVQRFSRQVELIVVDNASTDGTREWAENELSNGATFRYVRYDNAVGIDDSFERSVACTHGRYVCIFGDDDLALPGFVARTIQICASPHQPGLIYFNHRIGDAELLDTSEICHMPASGPIEFSCTRAFIHKFIHWPSFISSIVFQRSVWNAGKPLARDEYYGYRFLSQIYFGLGERNCAYEPEPLLIQRRGIQSWKSDWPRYSLVNLPRLLFALDKRGVSLDALRRWQMRECTLIGVAQICLVAKAYGYVASDPFWKECMRYQTGSKRMIVWLVQRLVPQFVITPLYFRHSKYRGNKKS